MIADELGTCGFFEIEPDPVWACLIEPAEGADTCVVFCNPLLEERINAHPYFVYFARLLARAGISALRFDYPGTGESSPIQDVRPVTAYASDADNVIGAVRSRGRYSRVGVFGCASASLIVARLQAEIDFAILWEPVLDNELFARNLFRANILQQQTVFGEIVADSSSLQEVLARGGTFSIEGHEITKALVDSLTAWESQGRPFNSAVPGLVVALQRRTFARLEASNKNQALSVVLAESGGAFWSTALAKYLPLPLDCMKASLDWLERWAR